MTLEELRERLLTLNSEAHDIRAAAEADSRDLTVEETEKLDAILAAFKRNRADIDRLEELAEQTEQLNAGRGRRTEPDQPVTLTGDGQGNTTLARVEPRPNGTPARRETVPATYLQEKNGGFRSLGDMAIAVHRAAMTDGQRMDPRLQRLASASTYGQEGIGADGGFAVPPDFRASIMETVTGEQALLSRCDQVPVSGNSFTCPVDETSPWDTSNGIQAYWDGEAAAATQSKPQLQDRTIKLNKIRALVPMTEELLEDASAMDAYLRRKAPEKINFKITLAILQGTGVGQPLGVLNSPALVTVTKESGQQANTIVANNVIKMYSRMYGPSRSTAVWVVNQAVEPQLYKLSIPGTDNTGNAVTGWGGLVYMPAGGLSNAPFGTMFGRPVLTSQACADLSSAGDIYFCDFSQYLALLKSGPNPRVDVSMHLWFDQDLTAFKFVLRMGGTPWWSTTAAARAGSNTYSPYVVLGAR